MTSRNDLRALHASLSQAYTAENLQRLTRTVIALHRNRQNSAVALLLKAAGRSPDGSAAHANQAFYTLMMTYHPDRLDHYRSELDRLLAAGDLEGLRGMSHLLSVLETERGIVVLKRPSPEPPAYSDLWDAVDEETGEYDVTDDEEPSDEPLDEFGDLSPRMSFFAAFKKQTYGNLRVELPASLLADLDVIDLSDCGIDDLDGVQHCVHTTMLDLSYNRITDISELSSLTMLRELYLGNNRVGYIDALQFLPDLQALDISYNAVDDLTPLFAMEHLEYVNAMGCRIPAKQVQRMREKGTTIIV
ncbi:MAG: hypothetical protein F9K22_14750 [Bacteroidetes bacterium]|nr:MAG: hypothetical protein F9K22_14750 [Bacteroidota bacterium]